MILEIYKFLHFFLFFYDIIKNMTNAGIVVYCVLFGSDDLQANEFLTSKSLDLDSSCLRTFKHKEQKKIA